MSKLGMEIKLRVFVTNEASDDELDKMADDIDRLISDNLDNARNHFPVLVDAEWDIS